MRSRHWGGEKRKPQNPYTNGSRVCSDIVPPINPDPGGLGQDVPGHGRVSDLSINHCRVGKSGHTIEITIIGLERNPECKLVPEVGRLEFQTRNDRPMECNHWSMPGTRCLGIAESREAAVPLLPCRTAAEIPSEGGTFQTEHHRVGGKPPTLTVDSARSVSGQITLCGEISRPAVLAAICFGPRGTKRRCNVRDWVHPSPRLTCPLQGSAT